MPSSHVVAQGECLSVIAKRYGFADYRDIYDHPANAAFKRRRKNPHVIYPGDEIVIPDLAEKQVAIPTGDVHTFVVDVATRKVRVTFVDDEGEPFANVPYRLTAAGFDAAGNTDGDGAFEVDVPLDVTTLEARVGRLERTLRIVHLDPAWDAEDDAPIATGIQARLANLGYAVGPVDGIIGPKTLRAIHAYQRDRRLPLSGPTKSLAARLEADHGA